MKNVDAVLKYITDKVTGDYILNCIEEDIPYGVNAAEIQEKLNIVRNNASTILNDLWKESELIKINTRPVAFIPRAIIGILIPDLDSNSLQDTYTPDELNNLIKNMQPENVSADPFQYLIGSSGSLANQISQAKAAIIYPPKGLHTLILGESGVGKTTFAYAMHEFGKIKKDLSDNAYPFISFNCSDYFNNPQLLLSQLFGHVKGAFTGADTEKIGLVEKADGGILFLDEIHRLPHDGQEMLFYLMDRGEFHRMGETGNKRKSNVLIIAATTEEPNDTLLATFLRRIPVVITLPSFREKATDEKIEIIQNAFSYESKNLNKKIRISPQVLKALVLYDFKVGNIGQLRSEIKLLCAKSFLEHLKNDQELTIEFKMLDNHIRENALNYAYNDNSLKAYLDMFEEDLIISPMDEKEYYQDKTKNDIYELILKKLDELKSKGLSKEVIESEARTLIENSFKSVMDSLNTKGLNINQLYKIVPKNITDFSVELIKAAEQELSTKFNNKFIFAFALHVQSLLKRIADEKPISNPNMIKIKKDYPEEFMAAKKLVKLLSDKFGVIIPEDEKGFLTILLANNKLNEKNEDKIRIFVLCHGYSTAVSMASVANTLLNSDFVKAIDMPLDEDISNIYIKLKAEALKVNNGKGLLLMVDMGSLTGFGEKLMNETGIKVRTIANVSTLLVIEALRSVLYKNDDLDDIYKSLINKDMDIMKINDSKKKAILTLCATGQGASMIAKNILSGILGDEYKDKLEIITTNYLDTEENIKKFKEQYEIIAVIGSFRPNTDIPYYPINKLLNTGFQKEFLKFIDTNFNDQNTNANSAPSKSVYEISKEMLEQYVKYINPKIAVANIKKFIDFLELDDTNENQDELIDLIVHMGCMLDRCVHKDMIKFDNADEFKKKNAEKFEQIRMAADILQKEYDTLISDDEVCYIIKVLNR